MTYNRHILLLVLYAVSLLISCTGDGKVADREQRPSAASMQQQFGVAPLPADTATSLIDTRPPIDQYNTPYLFPHEHPDLPKNIADWLSERGYVIPQNIPKEYWKEYFPINVIRGEFTSSGQTDIAVYCTNRKATAIIIFQDCNVQSQEILDHTPQSQDEYHPDGYPLHCCFTYISPIDPETFFRMLNNMENQEKIIPAPLNHDGIYYSVVGHFGASVFYKDGIEWISALVSD